MIAEKKRIRGWGAPPRYYQAPGAIKELPRFTQKYNGNVLAVVDPFLIDTIGRTVVEAFPDPEIIRIVPFEKEVTIARIKKMAEDNASYNAKVVIGIGGGKTLDTAKGVANEYGAACIIVPTSASTDAPITAHSMVYEEDGSPIGPNFYDSNPDVILVDSKIIVNAPTRMLVAGIGDALSTAFEARACVKSSANILLDAHKGVPFAPTNLGIVAGETCLDILLSDGRKAVVSAEAGAVTEAFENVLEANILLSGMGVIDVGCAASHAFAEMIAAFPDIDKRTMHGEKVGFGVLCHLILENTPLDYFNEILDFCAEIGLPITLSDLFVENTEENFRQLAEYAFKQADLFENEPFYVTVDDVEAAIRTADAYGEAYKKNHSIKPAYTMRK